MDELDQAQLSMVGTTARWTETFASHIAEAHALGHGPGEGGCLLETSFHQQSVALFRQVAPDRVLIGIARRFGAVVTIMERCKVPAVLAQDWDFLQRWFEMRSCEIITQCNAQSVPLPDKVLDQLTPGLLPYPELAQLASIEGVHDVRNSSKTIAAALEARGEFHCPLDSEQISILRLLIAGERISDIAARVHKSERSVYRDMERIWRHLGTEHRSEGLAIAVRQGWLD